MLKPDFFNTLSQKKTFRIRKLAKCSCEGSGPLIDKKLPGSRLV